MTDLDPRHGSSVEKLIATKTTINSLLLSLRMFALYSENHVNCEKMMARFHDHLTVFLNEHRSLTIAVKRDELSCEGEVIYTGIPKEGDIAFSLFRDGVQTLEFSEGFEFWETRQFVRILHQYRSLPVESEGDLVTALWEAQLPHLQYDAVENTLDGDVHAEDLTASLSLQQGAAMPRPESPRRDEAAVEPVSRSGAISPAHLRQLAPIDLTALELTVEDVNSLQEMVALAENADSTLEALEMLVDILDCQNDEELLAFIAQYLGEELTRSFSESQFSSALKILRGLRHIRANGGKRPPRALQRIEYLLLSFCRPESLEVLKESWSERSPHELDEIREILLLMLPEVIVALGPMLIEESPLPVRQMLKDVIRSHAAEDMKPLEALLDASGERIVLALINVLESLDEKRALPVFLRLIRHTSERVRREALKTLMMKDVWLPDKLFPLIADKSSSVRRLAHTYLGSRKSEVTERLLIAHLEKREVGRGDEDDRMACYKTLGVCGSERSISYLRSILTESSLTSRVFGSSDLRGAVLGLQESGREAAEHALKAAARSLYPGVRRAVRGGIFTRKVPGDGR